MLRNRFVRVVLFGLAAIAPGPKAYAGSDTAQLAVSVVVVSSCSINNGTLDFGQYASGQLDPLEAVGTISFTNCSGNLIIELDGGTSGNVGTRQMRSGSHSVQYQIYRNPTRSMVWGMGAEAREITLLTPQSGTIALYGRIPAGQAVPDGTYQDIINVTMTF